MVDIMISITELIRLHCCIIRLVYKYLDIMWRRGDVKHNIK